MANFERDNIKVPQPQEVSSERRRVFQTAESGISFSLISGEVTGANGFNRGQEVNIERTGGAIEKWKVVGFNLMWNGKVEVVLHDPSGQFEKVYSPEELRKINP